MSNALIAGPTEVSTPFTGTFLLEDGEALAQAIRDGDWLAGGMAAFSGVVDTVAAISNPLGTAISMGVGWVLEHVDPLKGWMNDLTGDAGEVGGFAMTWNNVAHQLNMSAEELQRKISDLSDMSGASVDAYRQFQREAAAHIGAAGSWAQAMGTGLEICSTIVKIVHDITRDAIAEVVGAVISYAAELVFTVGLATPLVIEQIATKVASLSARVGKAITKLVDAARALQKLLKQLGELLKKAGDLFRNALPSRGKNSSSNQSKINQSGGNNTRPNNALDGGFEWAEDTYNKIRSNTQDINAIAETTKDLPLGNGHILSYDEIRQIKEHVFNAEHLLSNGKGGTYSARFDADPDMAEAWIRLENGNPTKLDVLLLEHELAELTYLKIHPGATYAEAHSVANQTANWQNAVLNR